MENNVARNSLAMPLRTALASSLWFCLLFAAILLLVAVDVRLRIVIKSDEFAWDTLSISQIVSVARFVRLSCFYLALGVCIYGLYFTAAMAEYLPNPVKVVCITCAIFALFLGILPLLS